MRDMTDKKVGQATAQNKQTTYAAEFGAETARSTLLLATVALAATVLTATRAIAAVRRGNWKREVTRKRQVTNDGCPVN